MLIVLSFVNYSLRNLKNKLKKKFIWLIISEKLKETDCFEIHGFDNDDVNRNVDKIKLFLKSAKMDFINVLNHKNLKDVSKIVNDFKISELNSEEDDDGSLNDINIHIDEKVKRFI